MDERFLETSEALEAAQRDAAIKAAARRVAPEQHPDFDGVNCVECGNEIAAARLAMGKIRCVRCQSALEVRSKQYAHR